MFRGQLSDLRLGGNAEQAYASRCLPLIMIRSWSRGVAAQRKRRWLPTLSPIRIT